MFSSYRAMRALSSSFTSKYSTSPLRRKSSNPQTPALSYNKIHNTLGVSRSPKKQFATGFEGTCSRDVGRP